MNDTDLDIILAVADGQLSGQAKQDALARIASDPELGEELAVQIAAMEELKSLEPALMSSSERAALRSALIEQLNLEPSAAAAAIGERHRPWWLPALGLASAAALLLAIVVVPSMLPGGDDGVADLVAISPEQTTSVDTDARADGAGSDSGSADTVTSDTSITTQTVLVPNIAEDDIQEFFAAAPLSDDVDVAADQDDAATSQSGGEAKDSEAPSTAPFAAPDLFAIDTAHVESCIESLGDNLPGGPHQPLAVTVDDGVVIVHLGIDSGVGTTYSVSIDLDACTIRPSSP